MYREIEKDLKRWKDRSDRMPLLLRGARQIGKSYIVEKFGNECFSHLVIVNFEAQPSFKNCFETLEPQEIINSISLATGQPLQPGKSLLFLDEIQECPQAILAMRYFKEKMPNLHIIGAGSLLEFTLNDEDFRMPVGRVEFLYMKPCSFREYLINLEQHVVLSALETATPNKPIPEIAHEMLLKRLQEYFVLGGMPRVLSHYIEHSDMHRCQQLLEFITEQYRHDFGKYHARVKSDYIHEIYDGIPNILAQNFKYSKINPDIKSRDLKPALKALINAGLVQQVLYTSAAGLPLSATINEKKFKVLFVDIGLIGYRIDIGAQPTLYHQNALLSRGSLAEQFVGQELLAYTESYKKASLFYWERDQPSSTAEIDFLIQHSGIIFPIEVKAGKTGRLKSLKIFQQERQIPFGVRVSEKPLSFKNNVLSVPFYMISELPRLIGNALNLALD